MKKLGMGLLFIIGFSGVAMAQVWNDNTEVVGAVAQGRGGTAIAVSGEVDAVWSNPAGLALLPSRQVSLGGESFSQSSDSRHTWRFIQDPDSYTEIVSDPDRMEAEHDQFDHLSAGWPFMVAGRPAALWFGYRRALGFPAQSREWTEATTVVMPDGVSGPWTLDYRYTMDYSGGVDDWGAAFAMEVLPRLRAGILVHLLDAEVESIGQSYEEGEGLMGQRLHDYQFSGVAWTAGLQYDFGNGWTAGAAYRSGSNADYDYSMGFDNAPDEGTRGSSTLRWPDGWGMGLAWRPTQPLLLALDYSSTPWSESTIDEVRYPGGQTEDDNAYPSYWARWDQMDTSVWRLGAEYVFPLSGQVAWTVRAGYYRQEQVINQAVLPYLAPSDAEQPVCKGFSVGVAAAWGPMRIDAAYSWGSWTESAQVTEAGLAGRGSTGPTLDARVDGDMHRFLISATLILE